MGAGKGAGTIGQGGSITSDFEGGEEMSSTACDDQWNEERADAIGQNGNDGLAYAEDSDGDSPLSQAMDEQQRRAAEKWARGGMEACSLNPCGQCEGEDTVVRDFFRQEMVKQKRYQDAKGGDWIDECARTFTPEEFRGAMRFTVGKYLRRVGKKDAELQEVRKMRDYCQRWEAYLVAKEDDQ